MSHLTARERELVSLGAAMGSNCISCVEYHVAASRKIGLAEAQISEAIGVADALRQVPARKTLDAALVLLANPPLAASNSAPPEKAADSRQHEPCCGAPRTP